MKSLRLFTSNALNSRPNTITGVSNTTNIGKVSSRYPVQLTTTLSSVSAEFDAICEATSNKYQVDLNFNTTLQSLHGLYIGRTSISPAGGAAVGFKLNSINSGIAGYYKGEPVYYNVLFIPPVISMNVPILEIVQDWGKYSINYRSVSGGVEQLQFKSRGIPYIFDEPIAGVDSISLFISQSGVSVINSSFTTFNPLYTYTVGLTDLGTPEEIYAEFPEVHPSVLTYTSITISHISILDESETTSSDAIKYGTLNSLRAQPGKGLSITSSNSSSVYEVGSYLVQKDFSRTKNNYSVPLKFISASEVSRLQQLMSEGIPVLLVLLESQEREDSIEAKRREIDISGYVRILAPIVSESIAEGFFDVTLTMEEV